MSTSPSAPESKEEYMDETSPTPRWITVVFVAIFALVGYLLYASYTTRTKLEGALAKTIEKTTLLSAQVEQANSRLADVKGQLDVTSQKLGLTQAELARARSLAQTIRKEQKASDEKLATEIGQVKQESETKIGQVSTELGGAKTDIETTKKIVRAHV